MIQKRKKLTDNNSYLVLLTMEVFLLLLFQRNFKKTIFSLSLIELQNLHRFHKKRDFLKTITKTLKQFLPDFHEIAVS